MVAAWEGEGRGRKRVEGGEGRGGEWSMRSTLVIVLHSAVQYTVYRLEGGICGAM